ncbi:MAG: hypothetical protein N3B21_05745 [Clostridia bacterium]|nr:hypothetical protein [Clostridia bacterium]
MTGYLPAKYNKAWFVILLIYTTIIFCCFYVPRLFILNTAAETEEALRTLLLSFIISFVVCLFGYLGKRFIFSFTTIGVIAGLIAMIYTYTRKTGWEDLIGPIMFLELTLIGFALGLVLEIVFYMIRKNKRYR